MIEIVKLIDTVLTRAVAGTSGYSDTVLEKVNEAQTQAINILAPHWEKNQAVKDMLGPYIKTVIKPITINTGLLAKEDDYVHMAAIISFGGRPAYPINNNEVAIVKTSPIRMPGKHPDNNYYYQVNDDFIFLPNVNATQVEYSYIRKPVDAVVTYTPVETDEEDYVVPTGPIVDLEWPQTAFNLLLYLTLEKLGIEMKEALLVEYSNIGLAKEMINTEPQ